MATYNDIKKSRHETLSTVDVDTLNFSQQWDEYDVINRGDPSVPDAPIYITTDGTEPTAEGDDTDICMPGESVIIKAGSEQVKLIGSGNPYSVVAIQ